MRQNQQDNRPNNHNTNNGTSNLYPSLLAIQNHLEIDSNSNSNSNGIRDRNDTRDSNHYGSASTISVTNSQFPILSASGIPKSEHNAPPTMDCTSGSSSSALSGSSSPTSSWSSSSMGPSSQSQAKSQAKSQAQANPYYAGALSALSSSSIGADISLLAAPPSLSIDDNRTARAGRMQENDAIGTVGSSLYETLQEEAALCCPVCGFQVLTASGNSSTNNANTSTNASAVAIANTPTHMPIGTCFLCLQAAAEAQAQTETMIDPTSHIHTVHDKEDIAIANNNQSGYDMIDYHQHQHQHWMAREKQEEEDRQLAASLTAMILEEERVRREVFQHQDLSDRYLADTQATRDGGFAMDVIHRAINHHRSPHFHDSPLQGATNTEIAGGGGENGGSRSQYSEEVDLIPREWLIEDQEARNHNLNSSVLEENAICSDVKTVPTATHVVSIHHQGDVSHATLSTKDYDYDHDHDAYKHRATYIGDYNLLGQPHGSHGEVVWDNGNRYVGAFQNGMRSGQGTFFSRDGSEYTGGWKDNQMHGHGQRKFANGDTYIGQYRAGQRNGGPHWKLRFANGDLYVGGWENDRFHGDGRYFFAHDGSVLEGSFVCGAKQGKFKLQRQVPTEKLDILRFEDDELVGLGVRWNAKRTKTWLLQILPADPGPAGNGSSSNTSSNEPRAAAATVGSQNGSSSKTSSTATKVKKKKFHRRVIGCLSKPLRRRTKSSIETDVSMATLSMATPTATPLVPLVGITTVSVSNPDGSNGNSTQTTTSGPVSSSISPTPTPMPPSSSSSSSSLPPSFFLLPTDNLVPVAPQRILTNIKKSARIPISQAVSIGYDCEMGTATVTGKRTTASTVVATVSSQVTPSGQENVQRVVS